MTDIIKAIAAREHITPEHVYSEIEKVIAQAWNTSNQKTRQAQIDLIGKDSTPTPEELINSIVKYIREKNKR